MTVEKIEKINVDKYYVLETPKRVYVHVSKTKAENQKKAFEQIYNLKLEIKEFTQLNIFNFIDDFKKISDHPIYLMAGDSK